MTTGVQRIAQRLLVWEWVVLFLLLIPLVYVPGHWQGASLLVIPVVWGVRWLATGYFVPATPYNGSLLLLLIMAFVSLWVIDIDLNFAHTAGLIFGIAIFYGIFYLCQRQPEAIPYVIAFFLLVGTGMTFLGLLGVRWAGPFLFLRGVGTLLPAPLQGFVPSSGEGAINANEVAGILNWILPLSIALLVGLRSQSGKQVQLLWLGLLLMTLFNAFILVATLSRGGIVACAIGLMVMLMVIVLSRQRNLQGQLAVGLGFVAAGIVAAFILSTVIDIDSPDGLGTFDARLEVWARALHVLSDFGITGVGINGFRHIVNELYPFFLVPTVGDISHAHNHVLQAGLDMGIPGMIAYLSLWAISGFLLYRSWQRQQTGWYKSLVLGLTGSMVASWFFGLLDTIALGARPGFLWWLLLALIAAVHEITRQDDVLMVPHDA